MFWDDAFYFGTSLNGYCNAWLIVWPMFWTERRHTWLTASVVAAICNQAAEEVERLSPSRVLGKAGIREVWLKLTHKHAPTHARTHTHTHSRCNSNTIYCKHKAWQFLIPCTHTHTVSAAESHMTTYFKQKALQFLTPHTHARTYMHSQNQCNSLIRFIASTKHDSFSHNVSQIISLISRHL